MDKHIPTNNETTGDTQSQQLFLKQVATLQIQNNQPTNHKTLQSGTAFRLILRIPLTYLRSTTTSTTKKHSVQRADIMA